MNPTGQHNAALLRHVAVVPAVPPCHSYSLYHAAARDERHHSQLMWIFVDNKLIIIYLIMLWPGRELLDYMLSEKLIHVFFCFFLQ